MGGIGLEPTTSCVSSKTHPSILHPNSPFKPLYRGSNWEGTGSRLQVDWEGTASRMEDDAGKTLGLGAQ